MPATNQYVQLTQEQKDRLNAMGRQFSDAKGNLRGHWIVMREAITVLMNEIYAEGYNLGAMDSERTHTG